MRVLGVLVAWGVLAVLATLCFAVGGSIGYRRGVQDAVRQVRERRNSKAECRPVPLARHRPRPIPRMRARAATQFRRARVGHPIAAAHSIGDAARGIAGLRLSPAVIGAVVAVGLMVVPGVAVGATTAQPGDTLWPVKRKVEDVRLAMATSSSRRVAVHVDIAAHRLTELNGLLGRNDADPAIVDEVIGGLRDHTEAANEVIREVPVTEGPALAERVDDVVGRQVAVLDLLLGIDCNEQRSEQRNEQCVALSDTLAVSTELMRTATEIAMAGGQMSAGDVTTDPATDSAPVSSAPVVAASDSAGAAASEEPTAMVTAGPSPEPSASPSPSPSAPEDDAGAGDDVAAPPYAGTPSDSKIGRAHV